MIHWVYLKQMRSEANLKKLKLQHPPRDAVACAVAMLTVGAPIDLSPNLWMMNLNPREPQGLQRSHLPT